MSRVQVRLTSDLKALEERQIPKEVALYSFKRSSVNFSQVPLQEFRV